MRETLKAEIKKYTQSEVAEFIGTSSPTITKFLNGTQETSLATTLELVRYLKPKQEKKMMAHFINEVEKPSNIIIAMEYASTNRLIKTLDNLIKKHSDTSNHELKEYLAVYEIILNWQVRVSKLSIDEQIKKVRTIKATTDEVSIFTKVLEIYGFYYKEKFNLAYDLAKDVTELIQTLENEYLRKSYTARLTEIMSYLSLVVLNDKEQARQYASTTIKAKIGSSYTAMAQYVMGTSYMFEDYNKAKHHFEKAINIYSKQSNDYNMNEVKKELEYASAYHGIKMDYSNGIRKAMFLYTSQNAQIGSESILELDKVKPSETIEEMMVAEIKQDKQLLIQTFTKFIQEKNVFYASQAKRTLEKMNVDTMILDNLMNIFA